MAEEVSLRLDPVSISSRGMANPSNGCYLNAVLQCLVRCPPLYFYIMEHLRPLKLPLVPTSSHLPPPSPPHPCPVLAALVQLCTEFPTCAPGSTARVTAGSPFTPSYVWNAVHMSARNEEDAQEFLNLLLDKADGEWSRLAALAAAGEAGPTTKPEPKRPPKPKPKGPEQDGEWAEVRRGNVATVVTEVQFQRSPISAIFHGVLGSHVTHKGAMPTVTKQPFGVLPLETAPPEVRTLDDALVHLTLPCAVGPGDTAQVLIERAPPVLILHLKRWALSDTGAPSKVDKHIAFGPTLTLGPKVFPGGKGADRPYRLIGVIVHVGRTLNSGHYVCYVPVPDCPAPDGGATWLEFNDTRCKAVSAATVLKQPAYVLLYQVARCTASLRAPALPPTFRLPQPPPPPPPAVPSKGTPTAGPGPRTAATDRETVSMAKHKLAGLKARLGVEVRANVALAVGVDGPAAEGPTPPPAGLLVSEVRGGPSLLLVGDRLLAIDQRPLTSPGALSALLDTHRPGDVVTVDALRDDTQKRFRVVLGAKVKAESARLLARVAGGRVLDGDAAAVRAIVKGENPREVWGITEVPVPAPRRPPPAPDPRPAAAAAPDPEPEGTASAAADGTPGDGADCPTGEGSEPRESGSPAVPLRPLPRPPRARRRAATTAAN